MSGLSSTAKEDFISDRANTCQLAFRSLLSGTLLASSKDLVVSRGLQHEYGRFRIWASNIAAITNPSFPNLSLDYRLREVADVKESFLAQLDIIDGSLGQLGEALLNDSIEAMDLDGSSSEDSAKSSNFQDEDATQLLMSIRASTDCLLGLSNLVRKAGFESQNKKADRYQMEGYCENMADQWTRVYAEMVRKEYNDLEKPLVQRLAQSMLLRRRRIEYRRSRQQTWRLPGTTKPAGPPPKNLAPAPQFVLTFAESVAPNALAYDVSFTQARGLPVVTPSRLTATTMDTQQLRAPSPMSRAGGSVRFDANNEVHIPPPPGMAEMEEEVMCEYCCQLLPSEEARNPDQWRRHVKRDLYPYVCLVEKCDEPVAIYASSLEWLTHMRSKHFMRWYCSRESHPGRLVFEREEEFVDHMKDVHPGAFPTDQLLIVAQGSCSPQDPLFESCPFCDQDPQDLESRNTLEEHVSGHLISLALRSLPWPEDSANDSGGGSHSTDDASNAERRTRTTIAESRSWLPRPDDDDPSEKMERYPNARLPSYGWDPKVEAQHEPVYILEQLEDSITLDLFRWQRPEQCAGFWATRYSTLCDAVLVTLESLPAHVKDMFTTFTGRDTGLTDDDLGVTIAPSRPIALKKKYLVLGKKNYLAQVRMLGTDEAFASSALTEERRDALGILRNFENGIGNAFQGANVSPSLLLVGGVRAVMWHSLAFSTFLPRLSEMMIRCADLVERLESHFKKISYQQKPQVLLADIYKVLLLFCQEACSIFADTDGERRLINSFRAFSQELWLPFQDKYYYFERELEHYLQELQKPASLAVVPFISEQGESMFSAEIKVDLLNWLSTFPYEEQQKKMHDKGFTGIGDWLFAKSEYKEWFEPPRSRTLWCFGVARTKNSTLAANVMEFITRERGWVDGTGIVYVYFDVQEDPNTQSLGPVLRILLKQLCRDMRDMPSHLLQAKKESLPVGDYKNFMATAQNYCELFIVVDALDECPPDQQPAMIDFLRLVSQDLMSAKILITSRETPEMIRASEDTDDLTIGITGFSEMRSWIQGEVRRLRKKGRLQISSEALVEEVVRKLTVKSGGIFHLAHLQLHSLCKTSRYRGELGIRNTLVTLPSDLDNMYTDVLDRLDRQTNSLRDLALLSLRLVLYATRPLTVEEFLHATATPNSATNSEDWEMDDIDTVLEACAGLVEPVPVSRGVPLVELSLTFVKDCLENPSRLASTSRFTRELMDAENAHETLARTCLLYLDQPCVRTGPLHIPLDLADRTSRNVFLWYAALSFDYHAARAGRLSTSLQTCVDTLLSHQKSVQSVHQLRSVPPRSLQSAMPHWSDQSIDFILESTLAAATLIATTSLCEFPELKDRYPTPKNARFLLHRACTSTSTSAAARLLEHGHDLNEKDAEGQTPLYIAARRNLAQTVLLLVEKGAAVNVQGGHHGNALQAASCHNNYGVVQTLLDHGADVNAQGGIFGSALQAASWHGIYEAIQKLLDHHADVNSLAGGHGTALQAASYNGNHKVVQLLLDHHANVNTQGGTFVNALQAACRGGHQEIVKILLRHGADVNARGGYRGNALEAALADGHEAIVQLLIAAGAHNQPASRA